MEYEMRDYGVAALVFLGALGLALGCGSDSRSGGGAGGGGGGGGGDSDRTGITQCASGNSCQPGQYCDEFGGCENGCLADTNCAGNQTCTKEAGQNEGTCQNNAPDPVPGDAVTRDAFCAKVKPCAGAQYSEDMCSQLYPGTNAECHSAVVGGNCGEEMDAILQTKCGFGGMGDGDDA